MVRNEAMDRGVEDDPSACFVRPLYTRPNYRFSSCFACLPFFCCGGESVWSKTGCYCCVRGLEGTVGTICSPCCLPFACGCFPCNQTCQFCCKSNPCCLCATWAHDSIDTYLAIQLAR